ncbi:MAG: DUF3450 domain-containing protein [Marinospirillum sp.]|uniref:DUF3450 domain-containing protein n=1 Tax=Marinospirillum sp. TaxID=2183934 RepID=UPI0019DFE7CF|nr:DUF3450 domain-containing protein [Marinospirillum sp.]MBE0506815.1 DUF3450 domain-containing protein [Marinospirillum sp.]
MNTYKVAGHCCAFLALAVSGLLHSAVDTPTRQVEQSTQQQAVEIQQQIQQLDVQRQADFQEWRQLRRQTLLLEAHNERQADWNRRLQEQITSLEEQLISLDATREALEPLLQQMVERLEAFIQHDLPFRQDERLFRVRELKNLLQRVDVSHAEKFRHLLSAWHIEVEQGRSLEISREFIHLQPNDEPERLTLLRMGRIGLYYLSEDQQRAGYWSATDQAWLPLGRSARQEVIKGLGLAEQRGLPEFLTLPLSVPLRVAAEEASQ